MEPTDRRIIELLRQDGRLSYTDLGKELGLSTSAAHQRVRRLEERGIITGYTARIDAGKVGLPITAFISVTPADPAAPDEVPERLREVPEIEACHSVAGDESHIIKVRVSSPAHLEDLITRIRAAANVLTRTTIALSTHWE